jgi:hypothetical protein
MRVRDFLTTFIWSKNTAANEHGCRRVLRFICCFTGQQTKRTWPKIMHSENPKGGKIDVGYGLGESVGCVLYFEPTVSSTRKGDTKGGNK